MHDDLILPLMDVEKNERNALSAFTDKMKEAMTQYESEAKVLLSQRKKKDAKPEQIVKMIIWQLKHKIEPHF